MSEFFIPPFGIISNNESYSRKFTCKAGNEITIRLYTNTSINEYHIPKVEVILKHLDEIIESSAAIINELCKEGGIYEEEMLEYKKFNLIECQGNRAADISYDFNKKIEKISASDFSKRLKLRSIQISLKYESLVLDYFYDKAVDDVWAINYDLDMRFIDMTCES